MGEAGESDKAKGGSKEGYPSFVGRAGLRHRSVRCERAKDVQSFETISDARLYGLAVHGSAWSGGAGARGVALLFEQRIARSGAW